MMTKLTRMGDMLVHAGLINDDQLKQALAAQKKNKRRLGEELVKSGMITERQLIDALVMQLGVDYVDLNKVSLSPDMTQYVSKRIARKYHVVPYKVQGDELYLAMSDPLNFIATEEVKTASKKMVIPVISTRAAIDHAIAELYGTEGAKRAIREMQREHAEMNESEIQQVQQSLASDTQAAPSIRLVDSIIERGVSEHASDIHIEPQDDHVQVRMRVDGVLHNMLEIPKRLQASVLSRIKIMSGMDVTERRIPQDGRAMVHVHMREIDIRVSTLPTVHGEKIVLRILDQESLDHTAEGLGYSGVNLERYNELLGNTRGVVLIVGPTGSGKSSTMFSMIDQLNTESVNLVTLEDPVEYNIPGVNQVQINEKTGLTFAGGLRSILRQDPDIVAVGEIRDSETAEIAMRAAVTGHLVLSTIHTGDAVSTLDRLIDIGIEPYMIASALKGVISQRLVRKICPYCKEAYHPSAEELESMHMDPHQKDVTFYRGKGCPECYESGYQGRTVIAEVLMIDSEIREAIRNHVSHEELMTAVHNSRFVPISEDCKQLVLNGTTTVDEVVRVANTTD